MKLSLGLLRQLLSACVYLNQCLVVHPNYTLQQLTDPLPVVAQVHLSITDLVADGHQMEA